MQVSLVVQLRMFYEARETQGLILAKPSQGLSKFLPKLFIAMQDYCRQNRSQTRNVKNLYICLS